MPTAPTPKIIAIAEQQQSPHYVTDESHYLYHK
ncbi:hypothetical protein T12_8032 [Trichinella patagoniensis]|uniref:Uncharacterized protein n=1 Tax=Trichinella patagoniensis TaxID=990121 RepID=A0A0V0XEF7_9BILA|nr:hypothetical protein T12_8032 [Trichinella patagoniensis]